MEATMNGAEREEIRIGRAEYLALVRDRAVLDVIEADHAARGNGGEPLRRLIGELLDAGVPASVIAGRATAAATRRAAERAALRSTGIRPPAHPAGTANTSL